MCYSSGMSCGSILSESFSGCFLLLTILHPCLSGTASSLCSPGCATLFTSCIYLWQVLLQTAIGSKISDRKQLVQNTYVFSTSTVGQRIQLNMKPDLARALPQPPAGGTSELLPPESDFLGCCLAGVLACPVNKSNE